MPFWWSWRPGGVVRCLVVSSDARLVQGLRERGCRDVSFVDAADAAGALRVCERTQIDHAVLDAAIAPDAAQAFLTWWQATQARRGFGLSVAGSGLSMVSEQAERVPRRVEAVALALRGPRRPCLEVARHAYGDGLRWVGLTPSELATLHCLVKAARPLAARELLRSALGYDEGGSVSVVRAHIANLRRKCREAALPDPIRTVARVGYAAIAMDCRESIRSGADANIASIVDTRR